MQRSRIMESVPFTLSHAAAALPFRRTRLIPSAVVVGCFAPDLEYFVRLTPKGGLGHTFAGLFVLDLPLALAMLWLFHRYAKEPLWAILPQSVRQRIELGPRSLPFRDPVRMLLIAVSVLVGAATHLVWDSFTHDSFWPYRHVAFLSQTVVVPVLGAVEWYKILQHASSVFGLVAISVWAFSWYRSSGDVRSPGLANPTGSARAAFAVLALAAILAATVRTAIALQHPWLRHTPEILIAQGVITALSLLWVGIVVLGLVRSRSKARVERETLSSR